ncbi:hypothetical protein Clacol_001392 [Clathrus columnatus]|uniref:tripeptidyl-peptidase II n=1 Tax=Clathrus columnatus TaxID=1419009 RepID=A0AAV5A0S7_9AGAM|nr:hypothetical protein Clacol_001392 [Clathrus columnatus]
MRIMHSHWLFGLLSTSTGILGTPLVYDTTTGERDTTFIVKHSWSGTPKGWRLHSEPTSDHMLKFHIGLKQGGIDEVIRHLYEVSDPAHIRYGQHLSKEEVDELISPTEETTATVSEWLQSHGIHYSDCYASSAGDWLQLTVPISKAETMFNTQYHIFQHEKTGEYTLRSLNWSLPSYVHSHIDVAAPTTSFTRTRSMKKTSFLDPHVPMIDDLSGGLSTSCSTSVTPSCLRTLYNTANYTPTATNVNQIGIAGYLEEFANFADLKTFMQKFRSDAVNANFTVTLINGGANNQAQPGIEANLDTQYAGAMTFPTPNIYYSTGGSPPFIPDDNTPTNTNEPYLDWLNFISNQTTIPQTFSTSYGDDEQTVPEDFAVRVCNGFAQLGVMGSSVLFSSGDDGVGAGECLANDGSDTIRFQPNFPASCPYVTTVGATVKTNPEQATSFSGGGFSNYFAQPSYQASAVLAFLTELGTTNQGLFNASSRAYPDVAAQGQSFQVVIGGATGSVSGTSASCPTFAGVITLLNDFRLSNNKPSLGFLNPLIYANPSAFNDITKGNNQGCGTNGFSAGIGWDPVTGLGTPDFLKLQTLLG